MRRFLVSAALVLLVPSCSNPCEKLLSKVCGCPGPRAKAACAEARQRREARDKEVLDKERCKREVEKFRCEQLDR